MLNSIAAVLNNADGKNVSYHVVCWKRQIAAARESFCRRMPASRRSGSANLPWPMAVPSVAAGTLLVGKGSPEFTRDLHLVWHTASADRYPWIAAGRPEKPTRPAVRGFEIPLLEVDRQLMVMAA